MKTLLILAALFAPAAFAGEATTLKHVGFSADGKYYSYVEYGVGDGSGYAFAEAAIIEVATGKALKKAELKGEYEGASEDTNLAIRRVLAKLPLAQYGITAGKNTGDDRLIRLPGDFSEYSRTIFVSGNGPEGGAGPMWRKYELAVEMKNVPPMNEEQSYCTDFGMISRVKLSLLSPARHSDQKDVNRVLFSDFETKDADRCASEYRVVRVTLYKNALVVVLAYKMPGFEGPSIGHRIVTARQEILDQ